MPDYSSWFKEIAKGGADNPIEPLWFAQGMQMMGQAKEQMMRNRLMKMQIDEYEKNKNQKDPSQDDLMRQITDQYFPQDQQQQMLPQQQQPGQEQIPPMIARPPEQQEKKNEEPSEPSLWDKIKSRFSGMSGVMGGGATGQGQQTQQSNSPVAYAARQFEQVPERAQQNVLPPLVRQGQLEVALQNSTNKGREAGVSIANNQKFIQSLLTHVDKAQSPTAMEDVNKKFQQPDVQAKAKALGIVPGSVKASFEYVDTPIGVKEGRRIATAQMDLNEDQLNKTTWGKGLPAGRYQLKTINGKQQAPELVPLLSAKELSGHEDQLRYISKFDPDMKRREAARQVLADKADTGEKTGYYLIQNDSDLSQVKRLGLKSGQSVPRGWHIMSTAEKGGQGGEVSDARVEAYATGKESAEAYKRVRNNVKLYNNFKDKVREKYPDFDFTKADINYKNMTNSKFLDQYNRIILTNKTLDLADEAVRALNNSDFTAFNMVANEFSKWTGSPAPTNQRSLAIAVATELGQAYSNSNTPSVERWKKEMEQMRDSGSPEQLLGVNDTNRKMLGLAQERAQNNLQPYSWEEVRGEKPKPVSNDIRYDETKEIGGVKYGKKGGKWYAY